MNDTNNAAVFSAIRTLLAALGGALVAHGALSSLMLNQLLGVFGVLAPFVWGIVDKFLTAKRTDAAVQAAVSTALDATQGGNKG